jgi:hypothetical protein
MRRRFVRFAAFLAAIIAISTAVSCNKDTGPAVVDKPAYKLSLGEIPVSFGEGEAITVSIPIITDAPDSEIELADVPAWINAYVKEGTVVLEIAENNEQRQQIFEQYALIWGYTMPKDSALDYLYLDVHSPNVIRVNAVVPLFDCFYEIYGVEEGDGMYVAPSDRVRRW